jgi:hypothetical protein
MTRARTTLPVKRDFDQLLVRSVKTAMQIPFDNFFADWKTGQIRVPMNRALLCLYSVLRNETLAEKKCHVLAMK